jgi:glucose/mannose-6-phosphate isomerase
MNLDDPVKFEALDAENMLWHISQMPRHMERAWALAQQLDFPQKYREVKHVVILGMGGSAIGGTLLQGLVAQECPVPVTIVRDYTVPAFVRGDDCLVVASSYSGNTEETLSAFGEALARGVRGTAITTGGKLQVLARSRNLPIISYDYEGQPRAALGYSFTLLLGLFHHLGLLEDPAAAVSEAVDVMDAWQEELGPEVFTEQNPAKRLAERLVGQLPVVYGSDFLVAVANRWKTQLNENAKHWAFFEALPELHHNSVVGFGIPEVTRDHTVAVMLRSGLDHPRVKVRWEVTQELLSREGVTSEVLHARGESALAQMFSLIHLGDYVSFYLGMRNEVDPTPVKSIDFLKQRLAEAD